MGNYKFNPLLPWGLDLSGAGLGLSGTGFIVQTAPDTYVLRSLVAGAGISITNANGVSGNPTISATGGVADSSWRRVFLMMGA